MIMCLLKSLGLIIYFILQTINGQGQVNSLKKKLTNNKFREWKLVTENQYLGEKCDDGALRVTFIAAGNSGKWDSCINNKFKRVEFTWEVVKKDYRDFIKIKFLADSISVFEIQFINNKGKRRLRLTQNTESKQSLERRLEFM